MKRWDEKLASMSEKLAELSQKTAEASEEAKAARELRQEVINDRISTAKGNIVAFQERMRLEGEEKKSKFNSTLLKAQMTVEEKIRQHKEKKDRKLYERYIDDQISFIYENFETASYLISSAQLAILETIEAIDEYNEKYNTAETEEENPAVEAEETEAEETEAEEAEEVTDAEAEETEAAEAEEIPAEEEE